MKLTKPEKIWLTFVIIFFFLYNMPFFPAYGRSKATVIHAVLTIAPLWFCVYFGLVRICRKFKLKKGDAPTAPAKQRRTEMPAKPQAEGGEEDTSC